MRDTAYHAIQAKEKLVNELGREPTINEIADEMKLDYRTNYADGGANGVERQGDHADSPYFYHADFYHAESGDGLYILPQFKTIQQTSWWSCGVSCTEMVLDYFGVRGDWSEESLAALREDHIAAGSKAEKRTENESER